MNLRIRSLLVLGLVLGLSATLAPSYAGNQIVLPPAGTDFDYQLGGARSVPDRVGIVVRDREAEPLEGRYNVCYVNGFQTQNSEKKFWRKHWGLILKKDGEAVVDEGWGEWVLDTRTERKRKKLARIVGRWINGCADDGFDAVEFDNLDSFYRSAGLIDRADNRKYAKKLVWRAHQAELAAAQKNYVEWDGTAAGYDFAISEDCARWRECGGYVDSYGELVLDVEYGKKPFRRACANWDDTIAVVRRDLGLTKKGLRKFC